ncbi:hypothetical protein EDO6_03374 [Paenibacillus xylanexedens]|nr:hypothetical protein EDO6_03374 [Paenibacillus xylanexedens]
MSIRSYKGIELYEQVDGMEFEITGVDDGLNFVSYGLQIRTII